MKKKLPTGLSTLANIINGGYIYVDKTKYIHSILQNHRFAFLSRPRRFGKSLTIDTIDMIFQGRKELFDGLRIQNNRNWDDIHPVVRIDFGAGNRDTIANIELLVLSALSKVERKYDISLPNIPASQKMEKLISILKEKTGQNVIVLIDEYDKPILDNIDVADLSIFRDWMRNFYSTIKACDADIHFAMMTGVSKFAKTSVFSGPNNFTDVSLLPELGMLCGYTEDEITDNFAERIEDVDRTKMKKRYNGYDFLGTDKVYNPFGTLQFLGAKTYKNYRFQSGTPTFLIKVLKSQTYFQTIQQLSNCTISDNDLNKFDVDKIKIESLFFQAGYLTIDKTIELPMGISYKLKIPNHEVKTSLSDLILSDYFGFDGDKYTVQRLLYEAVNEGKPELFVKQIDILFSSIAYSNFTKNNISDYEGFYTSIVYTMLYATGFEIVQEDITSQGRIDLTLLRNNTARVIEFKVEKSGAKALNQIKTNNYANKYTNCQKVYLLGIDFDKKSRKVDNWEVEVI